MKVPEKIKNIRVDYTEVKHLNTNNNMSETIDLSKVSAKDLAAALMKQTAKENRKLEKEKRQYELERDTMVNDMIGHAKEVSKELSLFKQVCHASMDKQAAKLAKYGKIRGNSKGGFSVTNTEGNLRVVRRRDTIPSWDERSTKALELIHSFLHDTVKKRDKDMFEVLMTFLQRNKNGDLEYSRVMDLLAHEDKWNDERWVEGLRLIKQSFHTHLRGFAYEFKEKDGTGKWVSIQLNFSAV